MRVAARIRQHKAPGPIGRFRHAVTETGLANQCRLLIPGHPENGHGFPERCWLGIAKMEHVGIDLRQQSFGNFEQLQQICVLVSSVDVVEHRTTRIGPVGRVNLPAFQLPQEKAVDRACSQHALCCARAPGMVSSSHFNFIAEK